MRSSRRLAVRALMIAALVGSSAASLAGENDSRTFFAQGRKLRADGNCNDAISAFQRALDLWPQGLGALRNIAECEEQLGRYASARNSYWSLRRAVLQSNDPNYDGWEKYAEEGYQRLASKVAKITVKIEGASGDKVQVTIDGKPLDPRLIGVELERDLGSHELEVRYGGVAPLVEKRTLTSGSKEVVTFKIPGAFAAGSASASAAPSGSASASGAPVETSTFPYRPLVVTGLVVGAASVIGLGISIGVREGALGAIHGQCRDLTKCDPSLQNNPSFQANRDTGATASALVNVFTVAAVVGAGAGIALWVLAPSPKEPAKAELRFAPAAGGGVLFAGGRF